MMTGLRQKKPCGLLVKQLRGRIPMPPSLWFDENLLNFSPLHFVVNLFFVSVIQVRVGTKLCSVSVIVCLVSDIYIYIYIYIYIFFFFVSHNHLCIHAFV